MRLIQLVLVFALALSSPALISSADAHCKGGKGKKCPLNKKCHKEGKDEKAAKAAAKADDKS